MLGTSRYAKLHGHRTVRDFGEMPSQLLEHWCWTAETLQQLSCHYSYLSDSSKAAWQQSQQDQASLQPPRTIPHDLVDSLRASKHVNGGLAAMRQVAFGFFDLKVHSAETREEIEAMDMSKTYYSFLLDLTQLKATGDLSALGHGYAVTAHYVWGAEMNYYSYIQYVSLAVGSRTC